MSVSMSSAAINFSIDPEKGTWNASSRLHPGVEVYESTCEVRYRTGLAGLAFLARGLILQPGPIERVSTHLGPASQVRVSSSPDSNGLYYTLTFALPEQAPLLLVKMELTNPSQRPVYVERVEPVHIGFHKQRPGVGEIITGPKMGIPQGALKMGGHLPELAFYSNGWQSWSYTGCYDRGSTYRRTRFGPFTAPMRVYAGTPQHSRVGVFASDFFGVLVDRARRTGILFGYLSQAEQFGTVEAILSTAAPALRMWTNGDGVRLDPGETLQADWGCVTFLHLDEVDPLGAYLEAAARQNGLHLISDQPGGFALSSQPGRADIPTGWCSWYQYEKAVTAEDVLVNMRKAAEMRLQIPLGMIQIDDGFEAQVGDWTDFSSGFPRGVEPLAAEIKVAGFQPGLWLAPFIVHPKAALTRQHPDWLLRGRTRLPVNSGFVWNAFCTALDLTAPGALDYAAEAVATAVHKWGFSFLKLDFLYAAALPGQYKDPRRTRAQVLRLGLQRLRQAAGEETHLLGCGCPLGSGLGLVDSMRISCDVDTWWSPHIANMQFFLSAEWGSPSARNAIHNSLTRAALHRRWWINDPDCLLLRPTSKLTQAEVETLATTIGLSGGTVMLSDDLTGLPEERLQIARCTLPPIGLRPQVLDLFDAERPQRLRLDLNGQSGNWHLLAFFNWSDQAGLTQLKARDFNLTDEQEYWGYSFWGGASFKIPPGGAGPGMSLPPHGVLLAAVREHVPSQAQYLGSSLHLSQGLEVTAWEPYTGGLRFSLERPGSAYGQVELALPSSIHSASLNGTPLEWEATQEGCFRFEVKFNGKGQVEIEYA